MTRTTSFTLATLALAASTAIAEPRQDVDKDGMFHFTFAGGTLPEYLKAVDEQFPEISIVVFPGGLEKIQVWEIGAPSQKCIYLYTCFMGFLLFPCE